MDDIRDCLNHIHRKAENDFDERARQSMIELFREISEDYEGDVVGYAQNQY
jgi:hypothetical protein